MTKFKEQVDRGTLLLERLLSPLYKSGVRAMLDEDKRMKERWNKAVAKRKKLWEDEIKSFRELVETLGSKHEVLVPPVERGRGDASQSPYFKAMFETTESFTQMLPDYLRFIHELTYKELAHHRRMLRIENQFCRRAGWKTKKYFNPNIDSVLYNRYAEDYERGLCVVDFDQTKHILNSLTGSQKEEMASNAKYPLTFLIRDRFVEGLIFFPGEPGGGQYALGENMAEIFGRDFGQ